MPPLTEAQKEEILSTLFPEQAKESPPPPEEDLPDVRGQRKQSWRDMVGQASLIKQEMALDASEEVAETFEGIGPQIGQVFKNTRDAAKLTALETARKKMGLFETEEGREELNRQIDAEAMMLLEQINKGIKRVEDLNPEELSNLQQGIRSGVISFAMMTPLLVASIFQKSPTTLITGMSLLTAGDSYTSGRAEGLSHKDAFIYGGIDGFIEGATEILPAKTLLKLFPGAKDAAGSFSKNALKFLFQDIAGEQAATILQNLNAYQYDLDKERLAIENDPNIDGVEKEQLLGELAKKRAVITFFATITAGGMQVTTAKMIDYGLSDKEIQETISPRPMVQLELFPEIMTQGIEASNTVNLVLAQTQEAESAAIQALNELEAQRLSILGDTELKKEPKKLKEALDKIDKEILAAENNAQRIEKTRLEFENINERLKRLREIEEELEYSEDAEITSELEQERATLLSEIKMEGPGTGVQRLESVEYTPFEIEEGVVGLENTPEAQKMKGKTGFFNPTVQRLYDELIEPGTADRIVTAYNTVAQKMADLGFTSQGTVDKKAPLVIKEMQKDLRRLITQSKNLLNKRLANRRLDNKRAEGAIEETEYNQKVLKNNQSIAEIEATIDRIIERSQEPVLQLPDLPENLENPYGVNSRFFVPGVFREFISKWVRANKFNNVIVYKPTAEKEGVLQDQVPEELQEDINPMPAVPFKSVPFDSTIRLYFYDMARTGDFSERALRDPLTGEVFYREYDAIEFVDPLSGTLELNENLLPSIEMDGKTYQALWAPETQSRALVKMMGDPAMLPENLGWIPARGTSTRDWAAWWYDRFKSLFRPRGVRPTIMEELQTGPEGPIAKGRLSERQLNRIFRDIAKIQKTLEKNIERGLIKIKATVDDEGIIYESGDLGGNWKIYLDPITTMDRFKELIAKSFRGNEDAQKELRRLGQGELVDAIVKGRKRISKNSRRIIDLVKKIDPDYTVYSKEKIEMLEDAIERYMGRIFGAYVFPDWRPPNRRTATKREKDQHNAAVEQLAAIYAEKQGTPIEEATALAEKDLDILYSGTGQQRAELFVSMFEFTPPYLTAETGGETLLLPQLKQKRADIPSEVRKALGEVTESWAQAQMTAMKQEQFIAVTEYLLELAEIGNAPATRFLSLEETPNYNTQITIPGDVLNPLNGYYTTPAMAQAIMKTMGYGPLRRYLNDMPALLNPLKQPYLSVQGAMGYISLAYLNLSIKTQSRNLQSAMGFPALSGNWQAYKNPRAAAQYIKEQFGDMSSAELDYIVGEGIIGSSVMLGERKAMLDRMQGMATWQEFTDYLEESAVSRAEKGKKALQRSLRTAEELYQLADDIPKIMNYLGERESGFGIFAPNGVQNLSEQQMENLFDMISELIVEQGGRKVTRSESTPAENLQKAIHARASFLTRRNVPNYNRLPNILDALRMSLVANFPGFNTAVITSQANVMKTALLEHQLAHSGDPAVDAGLKSRLQKRAAMRGVSNAAWMAGPGTFMAAASALRFAWKTAKVAGISVGATALLAPQALSRFVAEWSVNNNLIFVSDADEDGTLEVYDFSHTDGFTLISEPSRLLLKYLATDYYLGEEASDKIWDTFMQSLKNVRSSYTDEKIMKRAVLEFISGNDRESGNPYTDPNAPWWVQLKDRSERFISTIAPKIFHESLDVGKALVLTGEEALDKRSRERNLLRSLAYTMGFKTDQITPKEVINDYKISAFNNALSTSESWAKGIFYRAEGRELGYDDMPAMIAAYDELQRQHFEQVRDLRLDIHWMAPILGTSPAETFNFLAEKDRLKSLRTADRANIIPDRNDNPLYVPTSISSFVKAYDTELRNVQSKNPDLLSDQEISERVSTLAERIERLSYNKWAQKPVSWTWQGVVQKSVEFEENKKNQDITQPSTAELVGTLFPTED
tara:strand:- start:5482 stop:11220 length:5739 start_codon:yes stop_codon:yes gene_type:complete